MAVAVLLDATIVVVASSDPTARTAQQLELDWMLRYREHIPDPFKVVHYAVSEGGAEGSKASEDGRSGRTDE